VWTRCHSALAKGTAWHTFKFNLESIKSALSLKFLIVKASLIVSQLIVQGYGPSFLEMNDLHGEPHTPSEKVSAQAARTKTNRLHTAVTHVAASSKAASCMLL